MEGKVWSVLIPDEEYQDSRTGWLISGTIRQENGMLVRMLSEAQPLPQAVEVTPSLEDAYLYVRAIREEGVE